MCCLPFHNRHSQLALFLIGFLALGITTEARTERSTKPVRVVVPFSAGGGSDTLARFLVREINGSQLDGSPWVVINIPGAGGTIGSRHAKNALPNGRTILFLHDGILTAKLSGKATYGPEFFEPIAMTGKVGMVLAVKDDSPFETLPQLLDAATTTPDSITFAANLGAPSYYLGKLIENSHHSARFRYVQSGGGARRFADITGGHIQVTVFSVSEFLSFREGGLQGLAYFGDTRHTALPDIPTARENGVDVVYENLQGWWAPLRTPENEIDRIQSVLNKAFDSSSVQEALKNQSIDTEFLSSRSFASAVATKEEDLLRMPLSIDVFQPPRLEYTLLPLSLLLLLGLAFAHRREDSDENRELSQFPLKRRAIGISLVIAGYLIVLYLTEGLFFWVSSVFLLLLLVRSSGFSKRSFLLLIPCVAVPFLLVLLVEKLLGLPLP